MMNRILISGLLLALTLSPVPGTSNSIPRLAWNADLSSWVTNLSESALPDEARNPDSNPEVAVSSTTIHTLWVTERADGSGHIYYRRSLNGGLTFEAKVLVASDTRNFWTDATVKRMAVDGTTVHIALIFNNASVGYYRSIDNGASFEPRRILFTEPGGDGTRSTGARIDASSGNVSIAWRRGRNIMQGPKDSSIAVLSSSNGGATFNQGVTVLSDPNADSLSVQDLRRIGQNVYIVYTHTARIGVTDDYYTDLWFSVSSDGGVNFNHHVLSEPAKDGYHRTSPIMQDQHSVAKMAIVGTNVHVTWTGLDSENVFSVFYRRSTDQGATFGPLMNLSGNLLPPGRIPRYGLETIAAKGSFLYVVFVVINASGPVIPSIYLRRSADGGASFQAGVQQIADGPWWPVVQTAPDDPMGMRVHILGAGPTYSYSSDGGETFHGPVFLFPAWSSLRADRPQMAVGQDGTLHVVYEGLYWAGYPNHDPDIMYRRLAPAPDPSPSNMALSLRSSYVSNTRESRYDSMQVGASPDINFTTAMTMEAWIKPAPGSRLDMRVIVKQEGDYSQNYAPRGYQFGVHNGSNRRRPNAGIYTTSGEFINWGGEVIADGVWTHLAMTYDANGGTNNFRLYVNGGLSVSQTVTGHLTPGRGCLYVGACRNSVDGFTGEVDELRLWNRALPQSEILANMGRGLAGDEPGLAAYFNLDNTTRDMTGHGNDGVLMYKESFVDRGSISR
ncbi:MAG: hypothetical protein HY650_08615 [Acidobacteria bacterium]|nr:hypothetical protein [Acidobacteriota bacterium]